MCVGPMNSKTSVKSECAAQVNMKLQLQQTIYLGTKQNIAMRPMVMKRHFTQGAAIRLFSQPPTQHIYIWYPKNFLHPKPVVMEPALSCLSVAAGCGTVMTSSFQCPCTCSNAWLCFKSNGYHYAWGILCHLLFIHHISYLLMRLYISSIY